MKSVFRIIGGVMVVSFIVGIILLVNYYFGWMSDLKSDLQLVDDEQKKTLGRAMGKLMVMISVEITLGFLAFLFFLLGGRDSTQIVSFSNNKNNQTTSNDDNLDIITKSHTSVKSIQEVGAIMEQRFDSQHKKMEKVLWTVANDLEAVQGAVFLTKQKDNNLKVIELFAGYAYYLPESKILTYEFGEGLAGQVAKDGRLVNISSIPEGYISVISGLGKSSPTNLILVPIKNEQENVLGVIEIASFQNFNQKDELFLKEVALLLAKEIETNKITA
jgi:putative methionine-R-sulfoxide reductase with GAF domain